MKVSTKGRYALRVMLDLALHTEDGNISLKDVAERQSISLKYSEQIIAALVKAGFVVSRRGASGGYSLSRKPEEYTVGDIIRLMEGSLAPAPCLEGDHANCPDGINCVCSDVWYQMMQAVYGVIDNITLEDLAVKYRQKSGI